KNFGALALVHEPGLIADERFIYFHVPGQFSLEATSLHCFANAMQHEPSCLLRDADSAVNFVRTNTVLRCRNHPHRSKPFVQTKRRVFKDRPGFRGELPRSMMASALPLAL